MDYPSIYGRILGMLDDYTREELLQLRDSLLGYYPYPLSIGSMLTQIFKGSTNYQIFKNFQNWIKMQRSHAGAQSGDLKDLRKIRNMLFHTPFERVPLYISEMGAAGVVVRWRLSVGR